MTTPASQALRALSGAPAQINPHRSTMLITPVARTAILRETGGGRAHLPDQSDPRRRVHIAALALCLLSGAVASLACVLSMGIPHQTTASPPRIVHNRLAGLPLLAQGIVSGAMGGDNRAYRVTGLRAINPAQRLRLRFWGRGVEIASSRAHVGLGVMAYGRGTALRMPGPASVSALDNRVKYHYGAFTEWFVNGPRGLEQGFDVAAPPRGQRGLLTFALRLTGGSHPRLRHGALLLNGDGSSLRYGGLIATDAAGHVLRSWLQLAGGRLLIRSDDRGARYPLRIDPFVQQGELSDTPGESGEQFGQAVAVSGRTLVVGTTNYINYNTPSAYLEQGAAYVFTAPASGWAHAKQAAILKAPKGQSEEAFGRSVAISGNTIVIGAPFRRVGTHGGQGEAYIFVKRASGWRNATPTAQLTAHAGAAHEFFGESVAISKKTVLVGAPGRKVGKHAAQGAVDVFALPRSARPATPRQLVELIAPDGRTNDALGISVALSGRTVVAGADLHRVGRTAGQGAAYIFAEPTTGWRNAHETAELNNEHGEASELFGRIAAIWQDTVVIGAPDRHGESGQEGAAYVFVKPGSGWAGSLTPTVELTASDPGKDAEFGGALAISHGLIVAGAPGHTTGTNTEQGAAYVFVKPTSSWRTTTESSELIAAGGVAGDNLGLSVAVAGNTILLGAPNRTVKRDLLEQGTVYAFRQRG